MASANGGSNGDENCVVCCKAMNALLGSRSLKEKIQVVLNEKGQLKCPNGVQSGAKAIMDDAKLVIDNLSKRGSGKPTLLSTIRSLFQKDITDITIEGAKVLYAK